MAFHSIYISDYAFSRMAATDHDLFVALEPWRGARDGKLPSDLPEKLRDRVVAWANAESEKAKADRAAHQAHKQAELDAAVKLAERGKASIDALNAAKQKEAEADAGLARIEEYAQHQCLARDPQNAAEIIAFCERVGGVNPSNVDLAVRKLQEQKRLVWDNALLRIF